MKYIDIKLKNSLTSESCNAYFDERKETFVYTDASPVGISSIILQKSSEKNDPKIISYSSRALSTAEQHYSQIERECLSIVYACEHNRLYLYGRPFVVFNDHKAIVNLLNNPKAKVPLRIERMTLRLQGYTFNLKHVKGAENISDYPSRHPFNKNIQNQEVEEYINFVGGYACPNALSLDEIKRETLKDPVLQQVANLTRTHTWYKLDKIDDYPELKVYEHKLKLYKRVANELTISTDNDLILKSNRIVLPIPYQRIAVKLAHIGHLGVVKTKALLRSKSYFPGMDKAVEDEISRCMSCQAVGRGNPPAQLNITPTTKETWDTVNIDYLGPLPNGVYVFVIMDQKSKFPDVEFVHNTSATVLIKALERIISTYGIPNTVISDNGPPFQSHRIREFMEKYSINHQKITPRWPQSNGEVERFMTSITKIIRTAYIEHKNWKSEVHQFLFAYRNAPHATTQIPPAELMFNRKCRYTIPNYHNKVKKDIQRNAESRIIEAKHKAKLYSDQKHHARTPDIHTGDQVLVRQDKCNKLTPNFEYQPYTVISTKGTMTTAQSNQTGAIKTRNISHFKKIPDNHNFPFLEHEEEEYEQPVADTEESTTENTLQQDLHQTQVNHRKQYPCRNRRPT